jgi:hypothetical protein
LQLAASAACCTGRSGRLTERVDPATSPKAASALGSVADRF